MKTVLDTGRFMAFVLASVATIPAASAQILQPVAPAGGSQPPLPGTSCTVEVLNLNGIVYPDGQMSVFNVPSGQGPLRMRATCIDPFGATLNGQSELVTPSPDTDVITTSLIDFGSAAPIAARLQMMPSEIDLSGIGTTLQLVVKSMFADQTSGDMTHSSTGTTYRTSNPNVATVGKDGMVTAAGNGTALISALNEGALGVAAVRVRSAVLMSLQVIPSQISLSLNKAFRSPVVNVKTSGTLADNAVLDLTSASSGITYESSNAGVAAVGPDGAVFAVSGGTADITVRDTQSGIETLVPVTATVFDPQPIAAYDTPGFAWNCDIDGGLVYIADDTGGLQIIEALTGQTAGALAFLGQKVYDVRLRGKLAAVALGTAGFALVDVHDPANPVLLSRTTTGGNVPDLAVSGNLLYAASGMDMVVYDITNPSSPVSAGVYAMGATVNAVAADTSRSVAVALTNTPALSVVPIGGTPPWPVVTLPAASQGADDVILSGTSAYVANGRDGVREVDITDPASPVVKAFSTLNFSATGIALRQTPEGTLVAAADYYFVNAVPLFDTSIRNTFNIDFSTFPGTILTDANSIGIALGDGFGVVTVGDAGIQVFKTQEINDNAGIAPTVSLTRPVTGSAPIAGFPVVAEATAMDELGVASVEFILDNMTTVGGDPAAPFTVTFPAPSACMTHVLQARATDFGGNVGVSRPVNLVVKCDDGQPCTGNSDCASNTCGVGICQPCSAGTFLSCAALLNACPNATSGIYPLDPDGSGPVAAFPVYCDMTTSGGGWTLAFIKNSVDNGNYALFGSGYVNVAALGITPEAASSTDPGTPATAGWLDLNTFAYTELRMAGYGDGTRAYTSNAIARSTLRLPFGQNGYFLYDDVSGYFWCGGTTSYTDGGLGQINQPMGAPEDCKTHGNLGNGWDFGPAVLNTGLTMCGGGSMVMTSAPGSGFAFYPNPGAAQAIWVR